MSVSPQGNVLSWTFVFGEVNTYLKPLAQRSDTVALQKNAAGRSLCFTEVILNVKRWKIMSIIQAEITKTHFVLWRYLSDSDGSFSSQCLFVRLFEEIFWHYQFQFQVYFLFVNLSADMTDIRLTFQGVLFWKKLSAVLKRANKRTWNVWMSPVLHSFSLNSY